MAHGKSLELAKIKPSAPSPICICGASWSSHMLKDGSRLQKRFDNDNHQPKGRVYMNRAQRRKLRKLNG